MGKQVKTKAFIHSLRTIASFALLGAVVAGASLGWVDTSIDFRALGAVAGAMVPILGKIVHFA